MKLTQEELNQILAKHQLWLDGKQDGEYADLGFANLCSINLENANLSAACLRNAEFYQAQMKNVNLSGAFLYSARLVDANLEKANLRNTNFESANLKRANLRYANLTHSYLEGATLRDAFLEGIIVNWNSHCLISEILWRASGDNLNRQILAALIGRKLDWCWSDWLALDLLEKEWAITELRKWVKEGDDAPEILTNQTK